MIKGRTIVCDGCGQEKVTWRGPWWGADDLRSTAGYSHRWWCDDVAGDYCASCAPGARLAAELVAAEQVPRSKGA